MQGESFMVFGAVQDSGVFVKAGEDESKWKGSLYEFKGLKDFERRQSKVKVYRES